MGKSLKRITKRASVLALCLCVIMTALSTTVASVDLSRPCSFTVSYGTSDYAEEMARADIVFDVYKVADTVGAEIVGDAYSYSYSMLPPYSSLTISDSMDNAAWQSLSQQAIDIALADDTPVITGRAVGETVYAADNGEDLLSGLYLIVPRGRDIEDYVTKRTNDSGELVTGTVARYGEYEYIFAPDLVGIDPRENLSFALKSVRELRRGRVEIIKILNTYETSEPATFVFSIDAVLDGENIYSNTAALTFDQAGSQTVYTGEFPIGTVVTVAEVYDGTNYRSLSPTEQTVTVESDETVEITFINEYSSGGLGGHGIINNFTYDGETWVWTQG